jgi:ribosomal protein L11
MNFCNNFNTITKIYPEGLPLWVFIKLFSDKTIELQLKTPPVASLLYSALHENDFKGVKITDVLKIVYLKWIDNKDKDFLSHIFTVFGTLKSFKQKLLI